MSFFFSIGISLVPVSKIQTLYELIYNEKFVENEFKQKKLTDLNEMEKGYGFSINYLDYAPIW